MPHGDPLATVTGLDPASGPPGTMVVITGTHFHVDTVDVRFGAVSVGANFRILSDECIVAYAPDNTGAVDVHVDNMGGTGTAHTVFTYDTYVGPPGGGGGGTPTVTSVVPNVAVKNDGGDAIAVLGTNFTTAKAVRFQKSFKVVAGSSVHLLAGKADGGLTEGNNADPTSTWDDLSGGSRDGTLTNFGYVLGDRPRTNIETDKAVWSDQSQYGNDGALNGFSFTTASGWAGDGSGSNPYRLVFDGSNDYVALPDLGTATIEDGSASYEVWFMTTSTASGDHPIIGEDNAGSYPAAALLVNGGYLKAVTWDSGGVAAVVTSPGQVSNGLLHHAVITVASTVQTLYLDGYAVTPNPTTTAKTVGTVTRARLGGMYSGYFAGSVLTARIWAIGLTAANVLDNYNAGPNASSVLLSSNARVNLWASNAMRTSGWAES